MDLLLQCVHYCMHVCVCVLQYIVCQTENSSIFDITDDGGTPLHFAAGKNLVHFLYPQLTYDDGCLITHTHTHVAW